MAKKEKKKILFVASECQPYAASGGLGDVIGSLPKALSKLNYDIRVVLPLYGIISDKYREKMKYLGNLNVSMSWRNQYCGIFELVEGGVTYYFIDNEYYFKRNGLYGYLDEAERYAFFSHASLDILPVINFIPQIIHCHDWQTSLIPVYLKTCYKDREIYQNIRTVFTIHNMEYQGKYSMDLSYELFGVPEWGKTLFEYDGDLNLMKGAIQTADTVTTVSPSYANEIKSEPAACGLSYIISQNSYKLRGILNGIDEDTFNPKTDPNIFVNFDAATVEKKKLNKKALQELLSLEKKDVPVVAMITRLVSHKGLDLVKDVFAKLMERDIQLVVLGTGDYHFEEFFKSMCTYYPNKLRVLIEYNNSLARKIYASCDMFLMPSKHEPCGLAQMICSEYGTVPIVRMIGGLGDSIKDYGKGEGWGFTFQLYNGLHMIDAIDRAVTVYSDKKKWDDLVQTVMKKDYSWKTSAKQYAESYDFLLEN